jgi:putative heme-binding domain-containing protein
MKTAKHLSYLLLAASLCACAPAANKPPATTQGSTAEQALRARVHALQATLLEPKNSDADREEAGVELASTKEGGGVLLTLASQGKVPQQLMPAISEAIFSNPDFSVRGLASQHFRRVSQAGALPPVAQLVQIQGDIARGKSVFFGPVAGCSKCHTFAGQGRDVGPDLTQVRAKLGRDIVFDSILNPSASIMFGYEAWLIETKEGDSYTGFIVSDGDALVLKDSSGERISIPSKDIALRRQQTLSIMPSNIALGLSAQDLADLVEFLEAAPVP